MNHLQRRIEPHFPELDDDVAIARRDVDRAGVAFEAFGGHVQLVAPGGDVLSQGGCGSDELTIDEHLCTRHISPDPKRADDRRGFSNGCGRLLFRSDVRGRFDR